jgi:hypothetical protein
MFGGGASMAGGGGGAGAGRALGFLSRGWRLCTVRQAGGAGAGGSPSSAGGGGGAGCGGGEAASICIRWDGRRMCRKVNCLGKVWVEGTYEAWHARKPV